MNRSQNRLGMLKKFWGQHFVPELLGRREIGLPSARAESNELIAKQAWYVKKNSGDSILCLSC